MIKGWIVAAVGVCLVVGLGMLVYARRQARAAEERPVAAAPAAPVAPAPAPVAAPHPPEDYLGVVVSEQAVDVAANLDGRLAQVLVRVGDRVQAGAPIATLDLRTIEGDLAVARAEVKAAKANDARARLELGDSEARYERTAKLGSLVPVADLDASRHEKKLAANRLESAHAGVAEAIARVAKLELSRTDANVRAPFPGLVAARYLDPGALVHAQTAIVRLISADSLRIRFAVPEDEARSLTLGAKIVAKIPVLQQSLSGAIEAVAPEVDPAARMIFVEARLDAPTGADTLRPPAGVVARVTLDKAK